jgi:hypothetical protein
MILGTFVVPHFTLDFTCLKCTHLPFTALPFRLRLVITLIFLSPNTELQNRPIRLDDKTTLSFTE